MATTTAEQRADQATKAAELMAAKIADDLFTGSGARSVIRLVLDTGGDRPLDYYGGWSRRSVEQRVTRILLGQKP